MSLPDAMTTVSLAIPFLPSNCHLILHKGHQENRFGTFLVWSCYVVAGLAAFAPLVVMVFDWNDPGHITRLTICLPAALVLATLGKILACLLLMTETKKPDKRPEVKSRTF